MTLVDSVHSGRLAYPPAPRLLYKGCRRPACPESRRASPAPGRHQGAPPRASLRDHLAYGRVWGSVRELRLLSHHRRAASSGDQWRRCGGGGGGENCLELPQRCRRYRLKKFMGNSHYKDTRTNGLLLSPLSLASLSTCSYSPSRSVSSRSRRPSFPLFFSVQAPPSLFLKISHFLLRTRLFHLSNAQGARARVLPPSSPARQLRRVSLALLADACALGIRP